MTTLRKKDGFQIDPSGNNASMPNASKLDQTRAVSVVAAVSFALGYATIARARAALSSAARGATLTA
jgi:hypothetical protein